MIQAHQHSQKKGIRSTKSATFGYSATEELCSLFEEFRLMCNDAIRVAISEKPKSRFDLIRLAYASLKQYGLQTHYVLSACEVAYSVYRNKHRKRVPYVRNSFLKLENQSYTLNHLLLRIPTSPRRFVFLTLQGSDYHLSFIDDSSLKRGSVTITKRSVSIAFTKESPPIEPLGYVGVDVNERNVTVSATNSNEQLFSELAEVAEIKERYKEIRAKIGRATTGVNRISKGLYAKFGLREKNRTIQRVHRITKGIVDLAMKDGPWVFGEVQRQITYKAAWLGVPVYRVNPSGTSQNCPDCGSRVAPLQDRKLFCAKCDDARDRDDLASRNMMACAVPQARPPKGSGEGERGDDGSNPPSRWVEVRLGGHEPKS